MLGYKMEFTKTQLIELLKDFPDDSVIEIVESEFSGYSRDAYFTNFNKEKHLEILDMRGVKPYDKLYVRLGST